MWRQRNALFKMTASGRKMGIFKIRSSSTASAKSGHCERLYPVGRIRMIVSPATDMVIVAALISLGVVYWLARRTKGFGGAIWGIPIQTRRNRYG